MSSAAGGFAGLTAAWGALGLLNTGDAFPQGPARVAWPLIVVLPLLAAGAAWRWAGGARAVFAFALAALAAAFWIFAPAGWWAHELPPPLSTGACDELPPGACVKTPGCILDQPTLRNVVCRAAADDCERSVQHAELIGAEADPAIDEQVRAAAVAACHATPGCAATSGECSCPCAFFGACTCECGGHYLARCARLEDAARLEGVPPP